MAACWKNCIFIRGIFGTSRHLRRAIIACYARKKTPFNLILGMKVNVKPKGEVNVVKIEGAIKAGDEYTLAEKMEKYIKPNQAPKFIVDLKKVPFVNSAALGIFLSIYKHVDRLNGRIVFSGLNSDVENLMEITKLGSVFEIFRSTDEALESFDF